MLDILQEDFLKIPGVLKNVKEGTMDLKKAQDQLSGLSVPEGQQGLF